MPALLWGVALTNIVRGVPIDANKEFIGNLFTLLNPMALLGGLVDVVAVPHPRRAVRGAEDGRPDPRGRPPARRPALGVVAAVLAVVYLSGHRVPARASAASWVTTVVAAVALLGALGANLRGREGWAFIGTFVCIAFAVATLFLVLFPDVMPSTIDPAYSLTTTNASSTDYTLKIMTIVALIFTPIVLLYQGWTYWVFRKRIAVHHIPAPEMARIETGATRGCCGRFRRRAGRWSVSASPVCSRAWRRYRAAFAVGALVTAVVHGDDLVGPITLLALAFGARAALAYAVERTAARAGVAVSGALRVRLLGTWLERPAETWLDPAVGTTLAAQGCTAVETYVTRYLPALVHASVVPVLAVGALFVVDWPSAVIVVLTLPLLPLFAALIGADHPGGDGTPLGRPPRAVRPLRRRRARPSDARRLRTGYAPGRDRAVGQRAPPRGDDGHPAAVVPVLRGAGAAGHALRGPGRRHGRPAARGGETSTCCPGWSRSSLPPRRTGRSAGWAPSSTPPPTVPQALDRIMDELDADAPVPTRIPGSGVVLQSGRLPLPRRRHARFCATSRSRPAAGSPW